MEHPQEPVQQSYAAPPPAPSSAPTAGPQPAWHPAPSEPDPRRKSPLLACFLSGLPGLGQVYVGYYRLGFVHILIFASVITLLVEDLVRGAEPLFGIFLAFFFLYNVVDAGRRAVFYNQALSGIDGVELPRDLQVPAGGGSIAAGVALIVAGFLLLSRTVLDLSLAWVADWWPVVPILVGAYLLYQALVEKADRPTARNANRAE